MLVGFLKLRQKWGPEEEGEIWFPVSSWAATATYILFGKAALQQHFVVAILSVSSRAEYLQGRERLPPPTPLIVPGSGLSEMCVVGEV